MRNMAVLHSPAFSYPLPVLVRVLSNLLIFKGKILYYNKDGKKLRFGEIHEDGENPNALFWMVRREEVKPLCLVEHHKEIYIIENLKA